MKTKPKWAKVLTAQELRHIAETSSTGKATLRALKVNIDHQVNSGIDCPECRAIAAKLGVNHGTK